MAVTRSDLSAGSWTRPRWPSAVPDPGRAVVAYNPLADELTVGIDGPPGGIVVPLAGTAGGVAVLVDQETGAVLGGQVDNLLYRAVDHYPSWRRLAEADPPLEVISRFLTDVRGLFDRFGVAD